MYMCARGLLIRLRSNRILQQMVDYCILNTSVIFHGVRLLSDQWQLTSVHIVQTGSISLRARAI